MELNEITATIIDAALEIHIGLGPGMLESVYEVVLAEELKRRGIEVKRQVPISFEYNGMTFTDGFKVDLLVENAVVVELKSQEKLLPVHTKQLLSYLRLLHLQVGLIINFGNATLKEGLVRVVNQYASSASVHR